uniref:Uncharacterized protein n=1 Tax=Physcomitrium patens TaxID=3218 RepID=A0A2K1KU36_PHYPA|nr:hypothetical protein PHYPA_004260 [Physcomitrium patens]
MAQFTTAIQSGVEVPIAAAISIDYHSFGSARGSIGGSRTDYFLNCSRSKFLADQVLLRRWYYLYVAPTQRYQGDGNYQS